MYQGLILGTAILLFSGTAVVAQSFYPNLSPSSYFVLPGQTFSVRGDHFAPGEEVVLRIGERTLVLRADAEGDIASGAIQVPFGTESLTLRAVGAVSQAETVRRVAVGTYHPTITPEKYQVAPGGTVSFKGKGFAPGEPVAIFEGGTARGSVIADAAGLIATGALAVPYRADRLDFEFKGEWSGAGAKRTVHVASLAKPWLHLSSYYVRPGASLTITGRGFGAREEVALGIDGFSLGSAITDSKGEFRFVTTVPTGKPGRRSVEAHGFLTGAEASQKFSGR